MLSDPVLLDQFCALLVSKGRAKNTIHTYRQLLVEVRSGVGEPLAVMRAEKARAAIDTKKDWSVSTKRLAISALRSFFEFRDAGDADRTAFAGPPKRPETTVVILEDERDAFLSTLQDRAQDWLGFRLYVMCLLMMRCGLRASEVVNLKQRDIDTALEGSIHVAGRKVPVDKLLARALVRVRSWASRSTTLGPLDPLFVSKRGEILHRKHLWRMVDVAACDQKMPWITPRVMRATAMADFLTDYPHKFIQAQVQFDIQTEQIRRVQRAIKRAQRKRRKKLEEKTSADKQEP